MNSTDGTLLSTAHAAGGEIETTVTGGRRGGRVDPHGRRLELMEWVELELQNRGWERGDVRVMLQLKHGCRNQIPRNSP